MALMTPLWMQVEAPDTEIDYSGVYDRVAWDMLVQTEGIIGAPSLKVTQRAAGANFSVDIAVGDCAISGDTIDNQGKYLCRSTAVENRTIPSPPVSGTRTHRVVAWVRDKLHDGTADDYEWILDVIPDLGSGADEPDSAITLALVEVSNGQTSVTDGDITDARPYASGLNAITPTVASIASLPASGTLGQRYRVTGYDPITWVWDGSSWRMDASAARIYKDRSSTHAGRTSTTLADDDQLAVTLLPALTYRATVVIPYTADAGGDLKWKLIPPPSGTMVGSALALPAASTGASGPVTLDQYTEFSSPIGGGSGVTPMTITVQMKMWSGDGGAFKLQWCRDGGTGTSTVLIGAFFDLVPVGS